MANKKDDGQPSNKVAKWKLPSTAWKKGKSGNPSGMRKHTAQYLMIQDLAKDMSEESLRTLHGMMTDPNERGANRVRCAEVILDRAWGRPAQAVAITDDTTRSNRIDAVRVAMNSLMGHPETIKIGRLISERILEETEKQDELERAKVIDADDLAN